MARTLLARVECIPMLDLQADIARSLRLEMQRYHTELSWSGAQALRCRAFTEITQKKLLLISKEPGAYVD